MRCSCSRCVARCAPSPHRRKDRRRPPAFPPPLDAAPGYWRRHVPSPFGTVVRDASEIAESSTKGIVRPREVFIRSCGPDAVLRAKNWIWRGLRRLTKSGLSSDINGNESDRISGICLARPAYFAYPSLIASLMRAATPGPVDPGLMPSAWISSDRHCVIPVAVAGRGRPSAFRSRPRGRRRRKRGRSAPRRTRSRSRRRRNQSRARARHFARDRRAPERPRNPAADRARSAVLRDRQGHHPHHDDAGSFQGDHRRAGGEDRRHRSRGGDSRGHRRRSTVRD